MLNLRLNTFHYIITVILCSLSLLIFRIDSFYDIVINIDEVLWLQQAKLAVNNPIPYLGFDSATSGPIAIYILTPLFWFFESPNVVDLRLYGLFYIIINIAILMFNNQNIKGSILEFIIFCSFLLIPSYDFFAYNSEWCSIPFVFYLISFFIYSKKINKINLFMIVLSIIILPLIKFQLILFSLFFYIIFIVKLRKTFYFNFIFIYSFLILTILFFAVSETIGIKRFLLFFVERNLIYANLYSQISIPENNKRIIFLTFILKLFKFYGIYLIIIFIYLIYMFSRKKNMKKFYLENRNMWIIAFIIVSLITIYIPKTNFDHYFQLLIIPIFSIISLLLKRISFFKFIIFSMIFLYFPVLLKVNFLCFEYINNKKHSNLIVDNRECWNKDINLFKKINNYSRKDKNIFFVGAPEDYLLNYYFRNNINSSFNSYNFLLIEFFSKSRNLGSQKINDLYLYEKNTFLKILRFNPKYIFDFGDKIKKLNDINLSSFLNNKYYFKDLKFKSNFTGNKVYLYIRK